MILLCLLAAVSCAAEPAPAATAVNLQTCTVTPTTGGLMGCPTADVVFAPVAPTTLVRSAVSGSQGWRAFSTLAPADSVVLNDGTWHALSTLTVAQAPSTPPTPPVTPPPVVPPPVPTTQDVTITSQDLPAQPVVFKAAPVPACFTVNAKQICVP